MAEMLRVDSTHRGNSKKKWRETVTGSLNQLKQHLKKFKKRAGNSFLENQSERRDALVSHY
jgi:hypothetical protein